MAAARASSISAIPPLVMLWRARKLSSVCTSTSKIALPIPRTSYFAEVIDWSCQGNCEGAKNPDLSFRVVGPTSPQRGEVDLRSKSAEGAQLSRKTVTPHPALRADLSL